MEDFSIQPHTGDFLASQIERIINQIGIPKFSGIVSDNGSNVALARRIIETKYKHILSLRCISHCFNLISKDIVKLPFAQKMIRYSNIIVSYFKRSHQANALLKQFINEYHIVGGSLKIYVETRWTSVYDCLSSISRLKGCLEEVC